MAERIDDIISPKAFEQVANMDKGLSELLKRFENNANAVKLFNAALEGAEKIKQVTDNVKRAADETAKLEAAQRQLAFANSEQGQQLALLKVQIEESARANKNAAKEMLSAEGSAKQMSAQLIRLRAQWDGMSEALRKSPLGQDLAKRINMVDTALKTLDSNTGRFQRNVGNYATATNSLSQVLRELPAFTYSVQTGILGISNNLPILIDQFRATAMSAHATTGAVIGTAGAFKIFLGSLFTWQSILTIAIGLFTIFSKEIFDFIRGANKATEEISELNKAIGTETGKIEALTRQIDNHNISNADRLKAAEELKKLYPTALKNYSAEEIAAGKAADAIMKIKHALIAVAMARAAQTDLDKKAAEKYDTENRLAQKRAELIIAESNESAKLARAKAVWGRKNDEIATNQYNDAVSNTNSLREEIKKLEQQAKSADDAMTAIAEKINSFKTKVAAGGLNISGEDISKDAPKAKKEKDDKPKSVIEKAKEQFEIEKALLEQQLNDQLISYEDYYFKLGFLADEYRKERKNLKEEEKNDEIKFNTELSKISRESSDKIIEQLKKESDAQKKADDEKKKSDEQLKKAKEDNNKKASQQEKELIDEWTTWWDNFYKNEEEDEKKRIDNKVKNFENFAKMVEMAAEIMSIAADIQFQNEMAMIDKRSKALEDSYDEEIKRLERSGMSKEKIEKEKQRLEAQTEAQRKNIDQQRIQAQKRKARADKAADIAKIITSTAAAVVGQLAATPVGPWNIALAAIMGALGAANLTRAIATPLPQFAKGTNSAPGGFAEVGEKGTELVIEPSGKKYLTPNKSTIMNVKKGSKIIPHHELMNQVRLAAMVKLSGQDSVSEMDYGNALIQAVIEQTEEQKRTRRAMERMNTTVIVNDNSSFQKWVTTYCK